jgi:lipid-A-disaccharide synthase-like uncharacterized protein
MKLGPIFLMILMLALSVWIILGISKSIPERPGAAVVEMIISSHKVKVEQAREQDGSFTYRFISGPLASERIMSTGEYQARLQLDANVAGRPALYRVFNVSTGRQFLWVAIGLGGQLLFSGRMIVQWLASEKSRRTVVPPAFWYMSLGGAVALAAYFIWRQDMVGLLGQSSGIVIYVRNIRLMRLDRNRTNGPDDHPQT